ncbi:5-oxoprolinase subunit C family protein [Marinobacter confluentis]|uniref:Biotin-dependent carboxyltransferase n=1 Tax=Marinobacter confluentis TaxID=1697557 RepID=A0A4Z1BZ19_9GAMM|nr:biotin-dependent carboxyltransferase family protein [Marinobacter confluentis]TGN38743.1 biotin-dependent carboxyltransferase [Marinobacter confluentis]
MANRAMVGFRVMRAGPLALLQDAGRFGTRHIGVTQGGPADMHAWAWANQLAGNQWGTPVLEVTLGGLELEAERDLTIAVTGADLTARHQNQPLPLWRRVRIAAGERVSFGAPAAGVRAYLAVSGGFKAEPVLGSVACVVREQLGGFDGHGRKLEEGDQLTLSSAEGFSPHAAEAEAPVPEKPDYSAPLTLDLLPGAQIADFTGKSLFDAFNASWQVDQRADRMGVRLSGPALRCNITSMVSEGISMGAVQVPPDGQPIALLNDRQTIGGYPRLGNLTALSASRLSQCQPGHQVRLRPIGFEAALREHRQFMGNFSFLPSSNNI